MKRYLTLKLEIVDNNDDDTFGVIDEEGASNAYESGVEIVGPNGITELLPGELKIQTELEVAEEELTLLRVRAEIATLNAVIGSAGGF